jgi:hypothetical protein
MNTNALGFIPEVQTPLKQKARAKGQRAHFLLHQPLAHF